MLIISGDNSGLPPGTLFLLLLLSSVFAAIDNVVRSAFTFAKPGIACTCIADNYIMTSLNDFMIFIINGYGLNIRSFGF